jgi:hypothetical protein
MSSARQQLSVKWQAGQKLRTGIEVATDARVRALITANAASITLAGGAAKGHARLTSQQSRARQIMLVRRRWSAGAAVACNTV